MPIIKTAQYRYSGPDRLDITVKGNVGAGKILAPTWEMVNAFKKQSITDWQYAQKYYALIMQRLMDSAIQTAFLDMLKTHETLTFVCFCPAHTFCHRILAAQLIHDMGLGQYVGETVVG
jgi:hypothetical protein